jgi:hypothetical protein
VPVDKREAEKLIADLLLVFDKLGALKERDEFLGFRRRLRLYASCTDEPYVAHMQDTVERLPRYRAWLESADSYDAAHKAHRLWELLSAMIETTPRFSASW